jgi:flagellar assembly protein FliH
MGYNKYINENDFDKPARKETSERQFTESELLNAKEASYQKGLEDGRNQNSQEIDAQLADALTGFQDHVVRFADLEATKRREVHEEAIRLAKNIATKICVAESELHAVDRVITCLESVTQTLLGNPKITISVHPDIISPLSEKIQEMIQSGLVQVMTDETIAPMDSRFSWAEGGAESILKKTTDEIEKIVENILEEKEI